MAERDRLTAYIWNSENPPREIQLQGGKRNTPPPDVSRPGRDRRYPSWSP